MSKIEEIAPIYLLHYKYICNFVASTIKIYVYIFSFIALFLHVTNRDTRTLYISQHKMVGVQNQMLHLQIILMYISFLFSVAHYLWLGLLYTCTCSLFCDTEAIEKMGCVTFSIYSPSTKMIRDRISRKKSIEGKSLISNHL